MNGDDTLLAFNRGVISRHAVARLDLKRPKLSAEEQTNWMPRALGPMSLRPGLKYIGTLDALPAETGGDDSEIVAGYRFFGKQGRGTPDEYDTAETTFIANLTGIDWTDSPQGFDAADGFVLDQNNPSWVADNGITVTCSGTLKDINYGLGVGRFPLKGDFYVEGGGFELTFNPPCAAFGFTIEDAGDFGSQLRITAIDSVGRIYAFELDQFKADLEGEYCFAGIISDYTTFASVTIYNDNAFTNGYPRDGSGLTNIYVATAAQVNLDPPPNGTPIPYPGDHEVLISTHFNAVYGTNGFGHIRGTRTLGVEGWLVDSEADSAAAGTWVADEGFDSSGAYVIVNGSRCAMLAALNWAGPLSFTIEFRVKRLGAAVGGGTIAFADNWFSFYFDGSGKLNCSIPWSSVKFVFNVGTELYDNMGNEDGTISIQSADAYAVGDYVHVEVGLSIAIGSDAFGSSSGWDVMASMWSNGTRATTNPSIKLAVSTDDLSGVAPATFYEYSLWTPGHLSTTQGVVTVGGVGPSDYTPCAIDEFRIMRGIRWPHTVDFTPQSDAYSHFAISDDPA